MSGADLKAPFPYFGGKSRAAPLVWGALGRVQNYVEPFFGSGAVLLSRPRETWATADGPGTETVNDRSRFLANFWRALAAEPDALAAFCDWPVNECVPSGTMIATPRGPIPVEQVVTGMVVLGERDGRVVQTTVIATRRSTAAEFVCVGPLRVTGNHPVWTADGYVEAGRLIAGNCVMTLDYGVSKTYLVMLYSGDESCLGSLLSERPADGACPVCGGDVPRSAEAHQRAHVEGGARREGASGLLDSVTDPCGSATDHHDDRAWAGRWLAGEGDVLDRQSSDGGADESHDGRRRNAWICPDAGTSGEVVGDAPRRSVPAGTPKRDAWAASLGGSTEGDPRCQYGTEPHQRDEGSNRHGPSREVSFGGASREARGAEARASAHAGAQCEDHGGCDEPKAGGVHRDGAHLCLCHGCRPRAGGERGVGLPGHPQRLPLQRESLQTRVAVHNFETTTGNYFAAGVLVHNCDLHARHRWLVEALPALAANMDADPSHFDAKVAGWWCWGACCWIGSGWCDEERAALRQCGAGSPLDLDRPASLPIQLPHVGDAGRGLHRKLPHVGDAGRGTDALPIQLPHVGGNHDSGRGVHSQGVHSQGVHSYLRALSERLRRVRVACGDWSRITGDSVTWRHGVTGVFLDPPYAEGHQQYAAGGTGTGLSAEVRAWAVEAGKRRDMRVVLAGLDGEHDLPGWRVVEWKARGGYGSQGATANGNRHRERLWLSPACLDAERQPSLFGGAQ